MKKSRLFGALDASLLLPNLYPISVYADGMWKRTAVTQSSRYLRMARPLRFRRIAAAVCTLAAAALLGSGPASALDRTWLDICTSDFFDDEGCWTSTILPNTADRAVFNGTDAIVRWDSITLGSWQGSTGSSEPVVTNANLLVQNSHFQFIGDVVGGPYTYRITNNADINTNGWLTIGLATKPIILQVDNDLVLDTGGRLDVAGPGSALQTAGYLTVGSGGSGTLNVLDGGSVTNTVGYVGLFDGGSGAVSVDGTGSSWSNASTLVLGYGGNGTLDITNGGSVSSAEVYIGNNATSTSAATVDSGSSWTNAGFMAVGFLGNATLDILNGSSVISGDGYLGYLGGSSGAVTVDGAGSSWASSGSLYIGGEPSAAGGTGSLTVSNSGAVTVANSIVNGAGTGTLNINGGTLTVGGGNGSIDVDTFVLGSAVGTSGSHSLSGTGSLTAATVIVGDEGSGVFTQTGGTHTVDELVIGAVIPGTCCLYNGGGGTYNLSGGELVAGNVNLGFTNRNNTAKFIQTGGTHTAGNIFGDGDYQLDSGNLTVGGNVFNSLDTFAYGQYGGNFTQTGGVHTIANSAFSFYPYTLQGGSLNVGGDFGDITSLGHSTVFGFGTLNLDGGTLTVGHEDVDLFPGEGLVMGGNIFVETLTVGNTSTASYTLAGRPVIRDYFVAPEPVEEIVRTKFTVIGGSGAGTFTQTGGLHYVEHLSLATESTGTGSYNLSGGNLYVGSEIIGEYGTGTFTQTGGTHVVGNANLPPDLDSTVWWADLPSFQLSGDGDLILGYGATCCDSESNLVLSAGSYHLSGGDLVAENELVQFGDGFTQTGGTNTVWGQLSVRSSYNLSGGDLSASSEEVLATGTLTQTGGTNNVDRLSLGSGTNTQAAGTFTQAGGTLVANKIDATAPGSQFNFTGGTLSVDAFNGNLVNAGGTLTPGNSPGITVITGDYTQLHDGTFDVEIGGLFQGTEYDWLDVSGSATLDGALNVSLFDFGSGLFNPSLGDSFDILTADTIIGEFDLLTLALLGDGLKWDVSYILDDFSADFVRLSVVSAVPVPGAVWLFGSGFVALIGFARSKKL